MIITVVEFEKINIGSERDYSKKQISWDDVEKIRSLDIKYRNVFKWGNNYLAPQQWVGVISLPNLTIEILPKVAGEYEYAELKKILIRMLQVSQNVPSKNEIDSKSDFEKDGLVEILISDFLYKLGAYIKKGFIKNYKKTTKNLYSVKGKIDFSKQINKNILKPIRFVCKYSELDIDNSIHQLIKYTLLEMKRISRYNENLRRIDNFLIYFYEVRDISKSNLQTIHISNTRLNARVITVVNYCYWFLEGLSVNLRNGRESISSILFDMNKIFEIFIYKSYKQIYGNNLSYQTQKNHLLFDPVNEVNRIKLKPDILIKTADKGCIVIDTKWKLLRGFAKETDAYQMNAYVSVIPNVNTAVLLYPKLSDRTVTENYLFNSPVEGNVKKLKVRTVDLSYVLKEDDLYTHLVTILD